MNLRVPSYAAPQFAGPVHNAYARITSIYLPAPGDAGRVTVGVFPDAASSAANKPPLDTLDIPIGRPAGHGGVALIPDLATLRADPVVGPALAALDAALIGYIASHPRLAGASQVS